MVKIYECAPCRNHDHKNCERSRPSYPPGSYGGSKCICPCHGDPNWEDKFRDSMVKVIAELFSPPKKPVQARSDELTGSD